MLPSNGNPHNQLAVLATYNDAEFIAVYRYARSLLVRCPFATARNNLDIVFVKNTGRTAKLQGDMDRALGDSTNRRKRSLGHQAVRLLLARVVSLVGTLHTAEDFNNNVVAAPALADAICAEIRRLLALGGISDGTLLKMAVVLIFTVVDLDHPTHVRGGGDGGGGDRGETKEDRGDRGVRVASEAEYCELDPTLSRPSP